MKSKTEKEAVSMKIRSTLILCLLSAILFNGCGVTNIRSRVDSNPLKNIAEKASRDYSVEWIDDETLKISDWWPTHSILSLGYSAFHADLHYSDTVLEGDYYLQSNQLGMLFITTTIDAGPGSFGGALKPYMRSQIDEVLGYAGTSMQSSTVTHNKSKKVLK
jgi:hypothetical protein